MTWSEYFQMRRRRKIWANATSVPTSIGGLLLGASYFANLNLEGDAGQTIMGIDPMFVYGGSTLACMLGGWLVGPTIGNVLFSATHPKLARGNPPPLEVMDREFYHRIKDRRADPSRQSVTNPAPDFYGEKIVSIPTYRRWLKDQKAYDRKASHGVPGEEE
jgi:import inner membrane translocase subunit TIM23